MENIKRSNSVLNKRHISSTSNLNTEWHYDFLFTYLVELKEQSTASAVYLISSNSWIKQRYYLLHVELVIKWWTKAKYQTIDTILPFECLFIRSLFLSFLFLLWNMSFFTFRNTWTCLEYHKRAWCVAVHIFSPFSRFLNCSVLFLHLYHVKLFPSVNCSLQNENILTQFIYLQHEKLAAWWCVAWYGEN